MYEIKVYESFRELLEDWDFSYWETNKEEIEVCKESLASFLDQPGLSYSYFSIYKNGQIVHAFWCKFKGDEFVFFNPDDDINNFYVVYVDKKCHYKAFFDISEAEEFVRELRGEI